MPLRSTGVIGVDNQTVHNTNVVESCQTSQVYYLGGTRKVVQFNENELQVKRLDCMRVTDRASSSPNAKLIPNSLIHANDNFQMNAVSRQSQKGQQQQSQYQQLQVDRSVPTANQQNTIMVSEELLEQSSFSKNSVAQGVNNSGQVSLTSNDLLNHTQIIKLVTDGESGNLLIDPSTCGSNTMNTGLISSHHGNSKVHVISNVTFVSKQIGNSTIGQTQQTINVVNAKGMPYLASKHQMHSAPVMPKIANMPTKNTSGKSGNGGNMSSPHNQNHYLPGASGHTSTGLSTSQKSTVPRNVQVVARTQNISASTSQLLIQNMQSPPTNTHHSSQQDITSANNQMVLQQKIMTNANTNNNSKSTPKKQTLNHSLKFVQHKCANSAIGARSSQNYFSQQAPQLQSMSPGNQNAVGKLAKSQKLTRQSQQNVNTSVSQCIQQINCGSIVQAGKVNNYCQQQQQNLSSKLQNSSNQNSCNKYIMQTQILSTVANQIPVNNCKVVTTHNSCNVINSNASVCNFNVLNNSNTSNTNSNSNYNINSANNTPLHGGTNANKIGTMGNVNANSSGNLVVIQNNAACGNMSNNNKNTLSGSTIKYVSAHGTVVQSQHMESPNQFSLQQQSQSPASKGRGRLPSQTAKHRNDQNFLDGRSSNLSSDIVNNSSTYMPVSLSSKQLGKNEEIMIVNGTQMTEEMSARILQSLSQKALHNNNTKQYQSSHATLSHLHDPHYGQKNSTITGSRSNGIDTSPVKEEYAIPIVNADCEKQDPHYMDFSAQSNQFHNHNISHQKLQISQRPLCPKTVEKTHSYERLRPAKTVTEIFKVIGDNAPAAQQAEHEDEIGEEIRPQPVSTTDKRIQTLHAVLQDHNYVAQMPTRISSEIQSTSNLSICASTINSELYVTSCNASQDSGGNSSNLMQQQIISPSSGNLIVPSNSISPSIGLPFLTMNDENRHDDDANSVISDESRTGPAGLDNDLGEETETAPEAEAEDDSVTRCICDLTHDDGYMICCDKCSAWQHVDCMGIDRQNIPDEYLCEICQPREVDRARAKNLQLTKRREQISFSITSAQTNVATLSISGSFNNNENHTFQNSNLPSDRLQSNPVVTASLGTPPVFSKKSKSSGSSKRKELLKRSKKERNSSKRRDVKRVTRRKKTSYSISDVHPNEKSNTSINQWLENYEVAVTNHYSPELRARLHAICKQQNVMQSVIATENKILKNCSGMQSKCTTVPFSGGKIVISNFDIQPNTPIVELRGKYMLTTQYKTQNPSVNTNNNVGTPHNPHAIRNQKIPGPFIFFYKLCNEVSAPEICVDTRTYANEARFVRRSCRPNAEIQHYFEKGTLHLYLVSTAFINGGTEITIKHEPHDLSAVNNKQISVLVAPTSTICACDAPKECLFSNHIGNVKISRKALLNGYVGEKLKSISTKKEIPSSFARGRSVSSSGESNIGLLSPSNQNAGFHNPPSIGNLQNDSGVYTSSSSPSVSLPSPTHAQIISSPTQQCQKSHSNPKPHAESLEIPVHSATGTIDNGFSKGLQRLPTLNRKSTNKQGRHSISEDPTTSAAQINFQDEKHENRKLSREERKMDAIIRAFEKMEKTQQRKQELKQARSTVAVGKTRTSTSPSPKSVKSQIAPEADTCTLLDVTQARKGALSSVKKRKRKGSKSHLTNQQKRRRRINSNDSDILSSGESCLLSPTLTSNEDSKPVMNSNLEDCENQINIQELVDSSNLVVNDQNINHAAGLLLALANNDTGNTEQVAVAQVNNPEINKRVEKDTSNVDVGTMSQDLGNQTPPMVSSTCLLVEAAVAPLENADAFGGEFKLPAKTKTKKSIMNDWLNQSLDFQHPVDDKANLENQTQTQLMQSFDPKGLDTLVQAAATICDYRRSTSSPASFMNSSNDEAQNISIAAKKVEEFIHQTNINLQSNEELSKQADMQTNNIDHQNHKELPVCPPHSINNCSGGSSVKKRWLRQAISEECSDELTTCLPATSPTQLGQNAPVGFTTPLKKRRVIRQCTEEEHNVRIKNSESPTLVRMNPSPDEIKTEIKDEFGEIDEEVDIINSPIQEEKIYKAESFVKIENEAHIHCKSEILLSPPTTIGADFVAVKEEVKDVKVHFSEIKAENAPDEKSCDSKNEVSDATEIQLQTATSGQGEDYVDVSDEIADIQKRLHSFHTENIMILQSRNKKSKISRSVRADGTIPATSFLKNGRSDKYDKGISKYEEVKSFKKEKHSSSKRKHLDFEDFPKNDITKFKEDDISKKEQMKSKQFIDQPTLEPKSENFYSKGHSGNEVSDHAELQLKSESKVDYNVRTTDGKMFQAALTIPNFNQTIIPPSTTPLCRSNYSLENSENEISSSILSASPILKSPHDGPQSDEKQISLTNEPQVMEDAEISQPPPLHLPYFNTIYGKLIEKDASSKKGVNPTVPSTNILLSDYLDTKVRSYSTLGGYVSHSALFGLNNSTANSSMELMNIGSVNCSQNVINKDDETVNSNDNNNNNSRIGGAKNVMQTPTNTKSTLFKTNETVPQCITSTCSKIMTKTANADPRLNPTLTAPEPAPTPKRKLSINEYRKRKQLSSEAAVSGNGTMTSKNLSFKTSSERTSKSREQDECREKSFGDIGSTYNAETINEAKVQFSPTPTLLEQQQETLCERLKSLKSQSSSLHSSSSPSLCPESNMALVPKLICNTTSTSFNSIKVNDEKEEFLLSHNVNISSLESISSSSSPVSSKESTPERDICRS